MKTKKSIRFANLKPIFLVLLFIFNINIIFGQNPPTSNDATVSTLEDNDKVFNESDFPYNDINNHPLAQIWITASAANGTLYYDENNNNIIDPGEAISFSMLGKIIFASDIPKLKFRPLSNENGLGYYFFDFKVHDKEDGYSAAHTMTIDVTSVNDAPSFMMLGSSLLEVDEDCGPQSINPFALMISAGPPDEDGQYLTFHLSDNDLFFVQPEVDAATGTLTFTPAPDAYGTANIQIHLEDDGGIANGGDNSSATVNFTITINPVNDPPTSADNTVTTYENSNYTFTLDDFYFEDIDEGIFTLIKVTKIPGKGDLWVDSDGNGIIDNGETALNDNSTVSVSDIGFAKLKYKPDADENGTLYTAFKFQVYDGKDFSISYNMEINIDPVNSEPYFTAGPSQFIFKSSEAQTVQAWATGISPGAPDETGQTLTFHLTADNESMFSVQPEVDEETGTLTYTPASDADGTANIEIYLTDDGGTANGGDDSSSVQNFSIMIIGTPLWGRQDENTILLNQNDNVGIGTNTPEQSLHIFKENDISGEYENASLRIHNYYTSEGPTLMVQPHQLWDLISDKQKLKLNFGVGEEGNPNPETETKFTFSNNAMMGIGTDIPEKQLHITNENEPTIRLERKAEDGGIGFMPTSWDLRSDGSNFNFDYTTGDNYYPSKIKFSSGGKIEADQLNIGNGNFIVDEYNVGIGTTSPSKKLEVIENSSDWATYIYNSNATGKGLKVKSGYSSQSGAVILQLQDVESTVRFKVLSNGNVGIGTSDPQAPLHIFNNDTEIFKVNSNGNLFISNNVGIGTDDPQAPLHIKNGSTELFKLNNNGYLYIRELIVQASNSFPDYVFAPEYKPMPLKELEQYIKVNRHLPEVPSALQVAEEGIKVGEMNTLLLKKIEELTLYVIEQQRLIEAQQVQIDEMKKYIQE
ncbi:MAG: hypothetical protein K8R54_12410 [Bacteroidales bacterium]|nr:hypothetical protein [Bacteroidales bacterium]